MSDVGDFGIKYSIKFESTYKRILRAHYRHRPDDAEAFEELFDTLEEVLAVDPYPPVSVGVPWPGKFGRSDWDLCKCKFQMPGLGGASGEGRLLYLVDQQAKVVCLLWVYTHEEHRIQPPTKELRQVVREAARYIMGYT